MEKNKFAREQLYRVRLENIRLHRYTMTNRRIAKDKGSPYIQAQEEEIKLNRTKWESYS